MGNVSLFYCKVDSFVPTIHLCFLIFIVKVLLIHEALDLETDYKVCCLITNMALDGFNIAFARPIQFIGLRTVKLGGIIHLTVVILDVLVASIVAIAACVVYIAMPADLKGEKKKK